MTEAVPLVSAGQVFAAISFGALLFALTRTTGLALSRGHARSRGRLAKIGAESESGVSVASSIEAVIRQRRGPAVPALRGWVARSGLQWEPVDLAILTVVSAALPAGMMFALTRQTLLAAVFGVVGAAGPWMLLRRKAAQRGNLLNAQVVDMVELVAASLRAGFGVVQSLELAAREQPEPMCGELQRVVHEVHLGGSTEEALDRFAKRADDLDLTLVVTAVLVQRRVGGDLSEVLLNLAGTIRDRIRVRGEVRALTAQARMSAWVVGLLPVALCGALFVIAPQQVSILVTDPAGRLMAGSAVMLELIGFWLVQRVAKIDY